MAYLWCNLFCALLWAVAASARHFSVVGYDPEDLRSEERLSHLFNLWCSRHGKLCEKGEEISKRFQIFKGNLEYIDAHNKLNTSSHWLGLNKFADLTNEEFKALYSGKILKPGRRWVDPHSGSPGHTSGSKDASCDAPSSLDWRKKGAVTGVKNQGTCGSCWAFSATGAIEGINAISTGDLISLSEQELVDCDTTNYACGGGYMVRAFEWVIQNGGIDTELDYPYTATNGSCNTVEGIYDGNCSNKPDHIGHAMLIVGYSSEDGEDYWIVKNSWGTDWGLKGYIYIRRNTGIISGVCAINSMASYPTKGETSPSPLPSPAVPTPPPPPPSPPPPVDCGDFSYCSSHEIYMPAI